MTEGSVFKGRHFDRSVILLCVRWYLAYNLSLWDLEEMMAERRKQRPSKVCSEGYWCSML
jgi:transposase-like protein